MHDVFVLYNTPEDPASFDQYYAKIHAPLVHAMPLLREFSWGKAQQNSPDDLYVIARMTYDTASDCAESFGSPEGVACIADVANFGGAGSTVVNVTRAETA